MKFELEVNEGKSDRIVRSIICAVLFVFAFAFAQGTARIFCIVLGIMMTVTTLMGWCPLYILFGFSTCADKSAAASNRIDSPQDETD
jgi:hypothetical protein